ncbi:MAG: 3-oxoacyl-ACP reductase FabG [Ectothiorhodospiraceae bacterium]|nr:3-oxoacyl-ACP reductase FabG [Ectothiorhodospiraceae bacterium]MCH8506489.1 3-oxoacyl-ACP reductase FabG [Ectothiorhodospiraceae bacterium]
MKDLKGKVALVTGGSRGIGAAIVRRLAGDGARVAFTYTRSEDKAEAVVESVRAAGGDALAIRADNRDPDAVRASVESTVAHFGRLDILVNSAGIFHTGDIGDFSLEDVQQTLDINVRAPFLATSAAAGHLPEGGRIITIGSNLAQRVPWPGISLYAMSKAALIGFTKGVARDLGPRGINVNVVHPGSTDTDMNPASGELADFQRDTMAIRRYSEPEEVAALVAWLAGPESRSVTGAELTTDNGSNA